MQRDRQLQPGIIHYWEILVVRSARGSGEHSLPTTSQRFLPVTTGGGPKIPLVL